jgi:MFS family permease
VSDQPELQRPESQSAAASLAKHVRLDLTPLRQSRDLRLLFIGGGVSFAGSMLTFVAIPYQTFRLTHSSLVVGLLSLAELAALLVTGLAGGLLADAVDRRLLLRITEAALLGGTLLLLVNSLIGQPRLWVLFAVSFLLAGLDGIQRPSLDSLVPRLVPPDQVAATSALMAVRSEFGMIAAPALSGVLIAVTGVATAYAVDAATFGVSLVCLWMMGAAPPPPEGAEISLKAILEGLRYAISRKDLLGSYLVDVNAMFFGFPNALYPQMASHLGGASVLGLLYAAPAVGSALVTLTSGWARRVHRHGRMIAAGAVVWGLGIVVLGLSSRAWEALAALVFAGAGDMVSGLGRMTMWNESIPDALRGRLAGIELLSYSSGPTLGNVESGLVEALTSLRFAIVSGGVLCVAGTAAVVLALPAFRNYHAVAGRQRRLENT